MLLRGAGRRYGERAALRDVTLELALGKTLVVFGPNGAGKSTLLRVLATLLRPTNGTARVLGHQLPEDAWKVRGRLGLLAHDPLLYRELTGRENLRFHARLHGVEDARIEELLDTVGMDRRADEPVALLSRGMVQRLAAARAVLHDPALLLLDEPTSGVDVRTRHDVLHLLAELNADGLAILITTHDLNGIAAHLPHLVCINGRITGEGTPRQVLTSAVLERTYGAPLEVLEHAGMPLVIDRLQHEPGVVALRREA